MPILLLMMQEEVSHTVQKVACHKTYRAGLGGCKGRMLLSRKLKQIESNHPEPVKSTREADLAGRFC